MKNFGQAIHGSRHSRRKAVLRARYALLGLLIAVLLAARSHAAEPANSDEVLRPQRLDPVTYEIDFAVVVTAPYKTKTLKVWLPLAPSDYSQEVTEHELTTFPTDVEPVISSEEKFGNRFAYFEFANPKGAQIIRHRFAVKVWELRWNVDPDLVAAPEQWPKELDVYLRGEEQAVVVDDGIRALLHDVAPRTGNPLRDLGTVMSWVNANFRYYHDQASLQASSLHALQQRGGHCSDYHGFCASMGRALGYPTRVTYGIHAMAKESPSHCKLEAYLPPYGWVSFDVSETQKLLAEVQKHDELTAEERQELTAAAQRRLLSGFRDNTWFLKTRGTDYELAPPASRRVAVVRVIYAEADGKPLPEPDPSSTQASGYHWMTAHQYRADRDISYPFKDLGLLEAWKE